MARIDSRIIGAAGEHYVICQLLRRGWIAAKAPEGVPNMDILVTDEHSQRLCSIQVKTRRDTGGNSGWIMGVKHETLVALELIYCFVNLGQTPADQPVCYIVSSAIVADVLRTSHAIWLRTPGRRGQQRKDNPTRQFLSDYSHLNPLDQEGLSFVEAHSDGWLDSFREQWSVLGLPQDQEF